MMVRPEMVTVSPEVMWNSRLLALPFTVRFSAPGPEIVTFLATNNSPLVNPIVPVTAKPIMSPSFASASGWRSEPGPLSFVLVTIIVGVGEGVGVGDGYCPQYLPPVFNKLEVPVPPQIIISLPVHTAVCPARASGASVVFVAVQRSVSELYLPPVFKKVGPLTSPPQIVISLPVHTAV